MPLATNSETRSLTSADPVVSEARAEDRGEPDRPDLRASADNRRGALAAPNQADPARPGYRTRVTFRHNVAASELPRLASRRPIQAAERSCLARNGRHLFSSAVRLIS